MAKRKKAKKAARQGSALCIVTMIDRLVEAASLAATASVLIGEGDDERAFEIALEIEPLLHEANTVLQAASILRRLQKEA
jgi:hypothetical protein